MAWFGKRQNAFDRRMREIDKELEDLNAQVRQLQRAPGKGSPFKPASTTYPSNRPSPPEAPTPADAPAAPPPPVRSTVNFGTPRQRELWSPPAPENEEVHHSSGRQTWWQSLFRPRHQPLDPKLVSYLSTGSFKTVRPLRYERRMARYRFVFCIVLLVSAILGLILALRHC